MYKGRRTVGKEVGNGFASGRGCVGTGWGGHRSTELAGGQAKLQAPQD